MAEPVVEKRLVHYKLLDKLGDNDPGDCLALEEAHGEELVKMGLLTHATEDDLAKLEEAEDKEESDIMSNQLKTVENAVKTVVEKAIGAIPPAVMPTVAAESKQDIYEKIPGVSATSQYILDIYKSWLNPNKYNTNQNRARAYEAGQAKSFANRYFVYNENGDVVTKSDGMNETTNASGGYLVNPEFSSDVYVLPHSQVSLEEMCVKKIDAKSNLLNYRQINESSWANSSIFGGLNMSPTAEGATFTSSLPAYTNKTYQLQKFGIFIYWTSELLEDAVNFYPILQDIEEYVRKTFLFGINTQIIQGTTLEGLANAAALVSVTKNSNDTAFSTTPQTCLTYEDITAMWARFLPDSKVSPNSCFLYHPALESSLNYMAYHFVSSGNANPAWGFQFNAANPSSERGANGGWLSPSKVMGLPAYPCAAMNAPGSAFDCAFVDFKHVAAYRKPFRIERSNDFKFLNDEVVGRWISRIDSKLLTPAAVTMPSGSSTYSTVVTRTAAGT